MKLRYLFPPKRKNRRKVVLKKVWPDVLFVPVGGTYTIDAEGALETMALLRPRIAVPMHFQTPALSFPLDGPEAFLTGLARAGYAIHRLGQCECTVSPDTLGAPRALLFDYARQA